MKQFIFSLINYWRWHLNCSGKTPIKHKDRSWRQRCGDFFRSFFWSSESEPESRDTFSSFSEFPRLSWVTVAQCHSNILFWSLKVNTNIYFNTPSLFIIYRDLNEYRVFKKEGGKVNAFLRMLRGLSWSQLRDIW